MKPERLLVPIDIVKCPIEVFDLVNGFAKRPEVTVVLLHVVTVNVAAPENRVYEELGREAHWHLEKLARKFLHPLASTLTHVRAGDPADQILAEAEAESTDLILLPTYGPSFWNRVRALWKPGAGSIVSRLAEKVIRAAKCGVFIIQAKTCFDCEAAWGRPPLSEVRGHRLSPSPAA